MTPSSRKQWLKLAIGPSLGECARFSETPATANIGTPMRSARKILMNSREFHEGRREEARSGTKRNNEKVEHIIFSSCCL